MSIRAMVRVKRSGAYKGDTLVVLCDLADCGDDEGGSIFPAVETLAELARLTRRGTQKILRRLEADGVLVPEGDGCPGRGGRGVTNRWCLDWDALATQPRARREKPRPTKGRTGFAVSGAEKGEPGSPFDDPERANQSAKRANTGAKRANGGSPNPLEPLEPAAAARGRARGVPGVGPETGDQPDPVPDGGKAELADQIAADRALIEGDDPASAPVDGATGGAGARQGAPGGPAPATPEAIVRAFDAERANHWPRAAVRKPLADDQSLATAWLRQGATVEFCRAAFDDAMGRLVARGERPLASLAYFRDRIPERLEARAGHRRLGGPPEPGLGLSGRALGEAPVPCGPSPSEIREQLTGEMSREERDWWRGFVSAAVSDRDAAWVTSWLGRAMYDGAARTIWLPTRFLADRLGRDLLPLALEGRVIRVGPGPDADKPEGAG